MYLPHNYRRFCRLVVLCLGFFLLEKTATAQEVIATSGESLQSAETTLDFTLGQLSIKTYNGNGVIITQGFHQTFEEMVEALAIADESLNVNAYPNPTQDYLTISSEGEQEINYTLYNLMGSKVALGKFRKNTEVNMLRLAKGTYQLLLTDADGRLLQTFKIQLK